MLTLAPLLKSSKFDAAVLKSSKTNDKLSNTKSTPLNLLKSESLNVLIKVERIS